MKLIPSSRRFYKDRMHAYGWEVGFKQTVEFPDGRRERHYFSDIGTERRTAIWNALRSLEVIKMLGEKKNENN